MHRFKKRTPDYQAMTRAQLEAAYHRRSDQHTRLMRKFDKHQGLAEQALTEAAQVSAEQEIMLGIMEQRSVDGLMAGEVN